ncbi:tRNA (guanosine(46)-N7)-methyltransferase TrmB [Roseibacillus persicicus]|uniref:tRNA (guanine-N(7)-)-methyltransferase n=1 Tax=Roseibacillus persicicus TaxID=454148 RepID=A0A918WKL1_9BACT|nr:tRNA (guanosine(46)-N7)-methyltransferase TrmB [Roseibacillus persicicus]GHC60058.1 tRNA (guanine-N(7)-)-methyltransferase [Roseibacillus persicicus]
MNEPRYRPPYPHEFVPEDYYARLEPEDIFSNGAPLEVDLGSGDGSYTLALAEHHRDRNFLAVERLLGRVQKTCRGAKERGLDNLKVLRLESAYTAEWLLPRNSVSRLHLVCPDPWPKAKHHRRRMIQQEFLETVHNLLVPGGIFIFKTDHEEYFEWAEEELAQYPKLEVTPFPADNFDPKSDFQLQWEAEGKSLQVLHCVSV